MIDRKGRVGGSRSAAGTERAKEQEGKERTCISHTAVRSVYVHSLRVISEPVGRMGVRARSSLSGAIPTRVGVGEAGEGRMDCMVGLVV